MDENRPAVEIVSVSSSEKNQIRLAESARLVGGPRLGAGVYIAQGAVLRGDHLSVGPGSMVLENCVLVATPEMPCSIGGKTVFGHRTLVVGAHVGNLCEIGNGAIILPGAQLGDECILGEGALVPAHTKIPSRSVVVGRPGRVLRTGAEQDRAMIARMRGGDLSFQTGPLHAQEPMKFRGKQMGALYSYGNKSPRIAESAFLFDSCEITGDVTIGENTIIGAGVRIIGDSHGPVRIGANVQILENSVLHLLPDNELVLEDDVVIGPGCMIHGCKIGRGSVVEPGANVSDNSTMGEHCLVRSGSLVKQRSDFPALSMLEGFPAQAVEKLAAPPPRPGWALDPGKLAEMIRV